jgi:hypothetical protein
MPTDVEFKARLVAMGSKQSETTFDQVRSPTSRTSTVKLLLNLSVILNRKCKAYDVPGAYLHARTEDAVSTPGNPNIYIRLPNKRIAKLDKFLYGLKQSGLEWYESHKKWIIELGFVQSSTEPCLFTWRESKDRYIILLVYVDDDLVLASDDGLDEWFHAEMLKKYGAGVKMKSDQYTFLGMLIKYEGYQCTLSMPAYCDRLVNLADLQNARVANTPEALMDKEESEEPADKTLFQMLLGTINFLALMCRPELLNAISRLATKVTSPSESDMQKLKRTIRFVKGTREEGIIFRAGGVPKLECYVDASFDTHKDSKSHTGYCFYLNSYSGSFFARSAKQTIVTLSSAEAESMALFEALTEVVWFRKVLEDIGFEQNEPTLVHEDNTAAIAFANGHGSHSRTKHFDRRLRFNVDVLARGLVKLIL